MIGKGTSSSFRKYLGGTPDALACGVGAEPPAALIKVERGGAERKTPRPKGAARGDGEAGASPGQTPASTIASARMSTVSLFRPAMFMRLSPTM